MGHESESEINFTAFHILTDQLGMDPDDAKLISRGMGIRRIAKHDFFCQHRLPADKVGFVVQGSFIGFRKEDQTNAFLIVSNSGWLGDIVSFMRESPSNKSIMALEDSVVLELPKSYHDAMMEENQNYTKAFIIQLVHVIEKLEEKLEIIQDSDLEEQIRYLNKRFPSMFERGKQKYLAKFLDITPEAFSRNLKKIELDR